MSTGRLLLAASLLLPGCGGGGAAPEPGEPAGAGAGGKGDDPFGVEQHSRAPDWLLAPLSSGTWEDEVDPSVLHAWVDARVKNRRFLKRVFVEVAAPYAGGAWMRTLAPTWFGADLGGGDERWGTDALELYPEGGPHGAALAGPVVFRLRTQEDPDGAGERMVVTAWERLYGDGEAAPPPNDPWAPGWRSPNDGAGEPTAPEVYYTPFDDAGAVVVAEIDRVIAALAEAPETRRTIHAAIFNINDPRLTDRLIAAHRAGVEVRLVTEATKLRPGQTWQTEDDRLLEAGVPLLAVRRQGRGAMHTKLALFDGRRLATGSFNWEVGSSTENHEDMLLTDRPELVAAYARRFEALAGEAQHDRTWAADTAGEVSVSFAPDEAPARVMGDLIDAAALTVHVAMFTCKDVEYEEDGETTSLFAKLGAAVGRGVDVRVITDFGVSEASEYYGTVSEDDPADERLEELGVHVVRADVPFGPYASMHHKLSVVDGEVAVLGAFNWYWDAAYLNDEDQLVWRDRALAADLHGELVDLLRRYDPEYDPGEWPQVALDLAVEHGGTAWGDRVLLVGDLPELGSWNPDRGVALDGADFPTWRGEVTLPAGVRAEYKLVTKHADGSLEWSPGANRRLRVPTGVEAHEVATSF